MAQGILWNLVSGIDPLGQFSRGVEQAQKRQTILEQLAGQREDRQFARDRDIRDFQFRRDESALNRAHQERMFSAQRADAAAANARAERAYQLQLLGLRQDDVQKVKNADGSESLVRVPRDPNAPPVPINLPNSNQPTLNPFVNGKMNDEQTKAALYANRMAASNDVLAQYANVNQGTGAPLGVIGNANVPFMGRVSDSSAYNYLASTDRQKVMQAQRDFVNAVLRRESGAVISESEFANAQRQYFPQPGDSDEVIQQKAANRLNAIQGIMAAAGPNYRVPDNYRPKQQPQPDDPLSQARAAIAAGADRNAVIQRLQQNGINPQGL